MEALKCMYSIVLPVYNEEETLPELFRRLDDTMKGLGEPYEVICIVDGSTDSSFEILERAAEKDPSYKVIKLSKNFGHQIAITAGLEASQGEAVIVLDADLQDPPEFIPDLAAKWKEGYDVVYAIRRKRPESFLRNLTIKTAYRIINRVSKINIPVDTGDFRLMSKRVVDSLKNIKERTRYLRGLSWWVGFKQIGIDYEREKRFAGKTKYSLWRLIKLALDGVTTFSYFPLQIAIYLGFFVSVLSVAMIVYLIIRKFMGLQIQGWISVMVSIFFFGGVQLFTFGIFGEYIGRIYEEVKQRPMYLVDRKINI
ncbi:MAG: glycosyltransferase family 2 protein [Candidatus Omnitrophota bacterium]